MDYSPIIRNIMIANDFEWDDAKAAANLAKHGVGFEQGSRSLQ
jgi:hypothetical protein